MGAHSAVLARPTLMGMEPIDCAFQLLILNFVNCMQYTYVHINHLLDSVHALKKFPQKTGG
jgi:hypothetical protein